MLVRTLLSSLRDQLVKGVNGGCLAKHDGGCNYNKVNTYDVYISSILRICGILLVWDR